MAADDTTSVALSEEERQAILLALGHLAADRPGWVHMLYQIAVKLRGEALFDGFRALRLIVPDLEITSGEERHVSPDGLPDGARIVGEDERRWLAVNCANCRQPRTACTCIFP